MSAILEKVTGMERVLSQKADLDVVDALEQRLKALEEKFESESRKPKKQVVANDHHEGELSEVESVARRSEEEKEIEKRRRNIVIYRVAELQTENVEERKRDDMSFLVDMGRKGLGVDIEDTDVEQFYRLGRKEEGKERPLLVKFAREEKKQEVMENLKELRGANDDRIRRVSIAHDLTWRQRERVKEVRTKALQDLDEESKEKEDARMSENFRVIVVGQQTMNPRALRIPINRT